MDAVTYRPMEPRDHVAVRQMISQAFHLHAYARRPRILDSIQSIYLLDCLNVSSYAQVAVVDGRVVGVIMARAAGQALLPGRRRRRVAKVGHLARILLTGFSDLRLLAPALENQRDNRELERQVDQPLDNEICLFAVDPSARGRGVGKRLFADARTYLRESGKRDFYLHTDTLCSYGFYDAHHMRRAAAMPATLRTADGPCPAELFVYTGQV